MYNVLEQTTFFFSGSVCVVYIRFWRNKMLHNAERAKKVVSDSSGLVDFAIGLVNSVFNLPDGQVMFFEEFK